MSTIEPARVFEYEFPVFVLAHDLKINPPNISVTKLMTLSDPDAPTAVAIFTDREAAEQFRDEKASGYDVFAITEPQDLVKILAAIKPTAPVVVFDPYRLGKPARIAPIDEVIEAHRPSQ